MVPIDKPRSIFKLPAELRLQIYEEVISDFDPTTVDTPATGNKDYYLPLLNTCQMIRGEASPMYLKHVHVLQDEARAKQDAAVDAILMYLMYSEPGEFEKLEKVNEDCKERCRKLSKIITAETSIA